MADVLLLALAGLFVLGTGVVTSIVIRIGKTRRELAARGKPRRLETQLEETDEMLRLIDKARTFAELDRIETQRRGTH